MMKRFKLYLVSLLVSFTVILNASPVDELFNTGVKSYSEGNYQEAVDAWAKIVNVYQLESTSLYNNIGNAYYKLTDYPNAILYYERAIKLSPANEDAIYNLNVANLKITDKIEPLPELFYQKWYSKMIHVLTGDQWAISFLILLLIGTIFFSFYIVSAELKWRKIGFYTGLSFYLISTLLFMLGKSNYKISTSESYAIVFSSRLPVKSSPSDMGTDLFFIHSGTKVEKTDRIGNWVKIKIADGNQGWIEDENIEVI